MIILILCNHVDDRTGKTLRIVSHGYDYATCKTIILPTELPQALGGKLSTKFGSWIIEEYPGEEMDIVKQREKSEFIREKKDEATFRICE